MAIPYFPNDNWWSLGIMASIMTIVAIVVAFYIAYKEAKRKGLNLDMFMISALWMGAGAVIGAKLSAMAAPGPALYNLFYGNVQSWGVLLGGFLGMAAYCFYKKEDIRKKHKKIEIFLWTLTDIWVLGAAIGTFFYRIGDFLTHCIEVGTPTNLPWAVLDNGITRHPINIYYSLVGLVIFVILLELRRTNKIYKNSGFTMLCFLISYSASRFLLDFLRMHYINYKGTSVGQFIYLILLIFGPPVYLLTHNYLTRQK